MERICVDCHEPFIDHTAKKKGGRPSVRCKGCQYESHLKQNSKWYRNTKYGKKRLGNNKQDMEILSFIRKKRRGIQTKKYRALPTSAFKKENEAEYV